MKAMRAAITALEEYAKTQEKPEFTYAVILEHQRILMRFNRIEDHNKEKVEEQKEELRLKVLDAERAEIRKMYENGDISNAQEKELRRFTNYIESIILYEYNE